MVSVSEPLQYTSLVLDLEVSVTLDLTTVQWRPSK